MLFFATRRDVGAPLCVSKLLALCCLIFNQTAINQLLSVRLGHQLPVG